MVSLVAQYKCFLRACRSLSFDTTHLILFVTHLSLFKFKMRNVFIKKSLINLGVQKFDCRFYNTAFSFGLQFALFCALLFYDLENVFHKQSFFKT